MDIMKFLTPITRENLKDLRPGEWIWDNVPVERRVHKRDLSGEKIIEPVGFRQIDILNLEDYPRFSSTPFMLSPVDGYDYMKGWTYFEEGRFFRLNKQLLEQDSDAVSNAYKDGLQEGREEAWKIASKLCRSPKEGGLDYPQFMDIFETSCLDAVFEKFSYQEIFDKIKAYEENRNFKVGDVIYSEDYPEQRGVVTRVQGETIYVIWDDGSCGRQSHINDLRKTGVNIADSFKPIFDAIKED